MRMFFSSGAAYTNGGGEVCMATYSLESWRAYEGEFDVTE